jgi:hypothetical protein
LCGVRQIITRSVMATVALTLPREFGRTANREPSRRNEIHQQAVRKMPKRTHSVSEATLCGVRQIITRSVMATVALTLPREFGRNANREPSRRNEIHPQAVRKMPKRSHGVSEVTLPSVLQIITRSVMAVRLDRLTSRSSNRNR